VIFSPIGKIAGARNGAEPQSQGIGRSALIRLKKKGVFRFAKMTRFARLSPGIRGRAAVAPSGNRPRRGRAAASGDCLVAAGIFVGSR